MKLILNHNHNTKAASPPLLPLTSPFLSLAPILLSYLENSFYLHSQLLHLLLCLLLQMHELLAHRLAPSTKICVCVQVSLIHRLRSLIVFLCALLPPVD